VSLRASEWRIPLAFSRRLENPSTSLLTNLTSQFRMTLPEPIWPSEQSS
jgi:hypothetical protein